ncbi:MAG: hydroxyacid-oxoacid transhydrogenase [Phototrophicaceae bacterium]
MITRETAFTMDTSSIKYGAGTTREVGYDMAQLGVKRVMLVTDPNMSNHEAVQIAMQSLADADIDAVKFDQTRIEPTDVSFKEAIAFAVDGNFDGFVAVGGGSSIDTAKVANLYATYPTDDFLDYVNQPLGNGKAIPGKLKPLIAIPTTAGTGSETTSVAVFDLLEKEVKTGISHRVMRPVLGILDPLNTATMPPLVAASSGLDVLSHAIESLTAIPFNQKQAVDHPSKRPPYQGSNPISDIWSENSIQIVSRYIRRAMTDNDDLEARGQMMLAASYAGIGFGNAGVHLPHAMSYPVAGMVRDYHPADYNVPWAMAPHGIAVIVNAPAVFRWTAVTDPQRHLRAAQLLGVDIRNADEADAGDLLAEALIEIMKDTGSPNGLQALGFTEADVDQLAEGAFAQQRLTKLSPRPASRDDFKQLFRDAMRYW